METVLRKCGSFLSHTECPKHWAFNPHGFCTPLLGPWKSWSLLWFLHLTTAELCAGLKPLRRRESRLWACPWLCHSQAQWPSLAMAVANALSRMTLATCRNHRGGLSTNLKPGKHSLSEFKHPHRQQPQAGICIFLLQLNPILGTPSTSSRCWCLKWAQVGKSQFPEGEIPFSVVRLLQGVKSSGQGTIFPPASCLWKTEWRSS